MIGVGDCPVRHPPQSGWLDGLGRLKASELFCQEESNAFLRAHESNPLQGADRLS
jgi:hypothetical protein